MGGVPIFEYTATVATFDGNVTYRATSTRTLARLLNISKTSIKFILSDEPNCMLKRFIKIEKKPIDITPKMK